MVTGSLIILESNTLFKCYSRVRTANANKVRYPIPDYAISSNKVDILQFGFGTTRIRWRISNTYT